MSLSDAVELAVLNQLFGGAARAVDATIFVALSTTDPGEAGAGLTEQAIGTGGYARVSVANNVANFPSGNPKTNGAAFTWPTATANWLAGANFTHVAFFNSANGVAAAGFLGRAAIGGTPKPVLSGDTPSIPAGSLTITMD